MIGLVDVSGISLPQSFPNGSLHALAVADMNEDGRPDIISNEQDELLPVGRENPRWILWENLGGLKFREHILLDTKLGGHELQANDMDAPGISTSAPSPGDSARGTATAGRCMWIFWRTC